MVTRTPLPPSNEKLFPPIGSAMSTVFKVICFAALVTLTACHSGDQESEEHVKFEVTSATRRDTSITLEYVCQIRAHQHIEIRALERGYLQEILVNEGQKVHKGMLMFRIMPVIYQAEYAKAAAEARIAEIEYLNTKKLADSNVVSQNELALSKANLDKAKAELALAQAHVDFTQIKASFDGIVNRLLVRKGSLLEEGDQLSTLSDNSEMWVYFNVPEAQYLNYKEHERGDSTIRVYLRMANQQVFEFPGLVTTIEADFNNETGNIAFRATFPNPNGLLRHGETGNILMYEELPEALLIPQKATFEVLEHKYVFVVAKDGTVHSRAIKIAAELPHLYAIKSGLQDGDKILLEGLRKVKEGQKIEYNYIKPDVVLNNLQLHAE